jgi:1,2-phenylacetyl-CoA epoxidase PaaB subunit
VTQYYVVFKPAKAKGEHQPFTAVLAKDEDHARELALDKAERFGDIGTFTVLRCEVVGVATHVPSTSEWKEAK